MQASFICPQCNKKIIQTSKGKIINCTHFNQNAVNIKQTNTRTRTELSLDYVFNNLTGVIEKIA